MKPLISIIIPVYNMEPYLRRCIDSVVAQKLSSLEFICVDDGSTDSSLSILKEYAQKDPRIKVISQKNQGLSGARNTGLKVARGEWVGFLDSDDYIQFDWSEKVDSFLTEDIDLLCWGAKAVAEKGENIPWLAIQNNHLRLRFCGKKEFTLRVARKTPVTVWNKLFRADIIRSKNIDFPVNCLFEDNGFYWKYFPFCRRAYFIPENYYFYTQREKSIMGKLFSCQLLPRGYGCQVAIDIISFYRQNGLFEEYQIILQKIFFQLFLLDLEHTVPENKPLILHLAAKDIRAVGFTRLSALGRAVLAGREADVYLAKNGGFLNKLFAVNRDDNGRKYMYLLGVKIYLTKRVKELL